MAKLSYATVRTLRAEFAAGARQVDLARKYGVTPAAIHLIVRHKIWNEAVCEINEWLAPVMSLDAAGLASLGIEHSGTDKTAKLYKPSDKARIKAALIEWLERLA